MALYTYSPDDVKIIVGGVHAVGGLVDGTFVEIEHNAPIYTSRVTMDGVVERVYNDNPLYHVTITLMQTSASNDVLTMMLNTDRLTGNRGKFPMMIRDTKGTTSFLADAAWIVDYPRTVYSNGIEARQWQFDCTSVAFGLGGNASDSAVRSTILASNEAIGLFRDFATTVDLWK
ncbi:DUF3277 family protein [Pseudomonas aeruginosa]|nr:DUF3277 family protein [Pseudomonas aeruginosa]ELM3844576.1 DUF3277 family protein [Pseudomonas aeruginosa]ELP2775355.1 DUF3277 family protein [Pseudomonas aeruginosa]ELX8340847.1 DUF3277 family protein [Pseudomonas aeruginosa]ELY0902546.1 DUF3277 family protein [Pseudomonas aeruginosa]